MKKITRMYEPWGYRSQDNYQGTETILENDLESFFAEVSYNKDDNKIHFANKDGVEKATLDVNEFVKSQAIVEKAWYENGNIHIKFTNGDEIVIDVKELLDETEFKDGLQVVEGQVSVLINTAESDEYISVGEAGIKLFGVKRDIEAEETRAINAETALDEKIDAEIARATAEETRIDTKLDQEIARATAEEAAANRRIDSLNDELDAEKTIREAADAALGRRIDKEIDDRTADVDAEETRAKAVEQTLDEKIDAETGRATSAETQLQSNIEAEATARADKDAELAELIEAEETRATTKETALDEKIDTEIADRKAEAVASAEYDKDDVKIYLKNKNGETLSEIDCNDFIVDGMIDTVELVESGSTTVLEITWNTAAGKSKTELNIGDIFEADNYYTKTEVDDKVTAINQSIADEASARENADTANADAVAAEKTRAEGAEAVLQTAIDAEATTARAAESANATAIANEVTRAEAAEALKANAADVYTKGEVDGKETALQTAINANATAITEEETARKNADDAQDAVIATLATKAEVEAVDAKVDAIDLDPYAKTADVNAALDLKADKTEIPTDFYTKAEVEAMMSQLLTRIENLEAKESIVVADTAADVATAPAGSDIVLASTEAIQALTGNTEFKTLTIVGGNSNADIKAIASDKLTVDGMTVNGDKGASNGRINISADTVDIKNVTIESGSTAYNVFEGSQNTTKSEYFTKSYNLSNLTADNTELNHNIANIYTPANDAVINIKDCKLNLDVDKSNLLRMANYTNATGVTINFENIEWTYENAEGSDWNWAGLMIFQPASADVALTGDTTKIETWTVNVKNCKYNGEKVTANNFGEHNQAVYLYNVNNTGAVTDASTVMTINFE